MRLTCEAVLPSGKWDHRHDDDRLPRAEKEAVLRMVQHVVLSPKLGLDQVLAKRLYLTCTQGF